MRLSLIILLLLGTSFDVSANPMVIRGAADLSGVDWDGEEIRTLSGDWRFYWNQLLSPEELAAGKGELTAFQTPEQQWQQTHLPGVDLQRWGAATYHIQIVLTENRDYFIGVPILNTASRIWINQELLQEFGRVTLNPDEAKGFVRQNLIRFKGHAGTNSITIQVSNSLFWFGGAAGPIRIGSSDAFQHLQTIETLRDALSFGFILFMSLYHIYIKFLLKRNNAALYLGLFCLSVALRSTVVGGGQIIHQIWPELPMSVHYIIEYLTLALSIPFILGFIRELYPRESPRFFYTPASVLGLLWAVFMALLGIKYAPAPLQFFQLLILIAGIMTNVTMIRAVLHRRDGARILLTSNFILFLFVVNDLGHALHLIETVPLVHFGLMQMLFAQSLILAQRFSHSFQRAEKAEHEVTRLNMNLEQKIIERTEQINTILAHARSGFMLIDRESRVKNGFTSSCESILGQTLRIGEILPQQLTFETHLRVQFEMAVQQIFASELPIDVAMQQLPARFPMGSRMIGLQGAAVRLRGNNTVAAVLLTINDVTDLVAAEEGLQRADVLIHILEDQDAFRIFLVDFKKDMERALEAIQAHDNQTLSSIVHTMKGNAASFNLLDWVKDLHRIEDQDRINSTHMQTLADRVRNFLRENEGILHMDFDHPTRTIFAVDQNDLNSLREQLRPVTSAAAIARIESWTRSVKALPLKSYTTPLGSMVTRVAQHLQKKVRLQVEGADFRVDTRFAGLLATLPHLVRNSLVHGIEEPEERGGKPEEATITIRFRQGADGSLSIEITDDGRGLDADRIRKAAREKGLIPAQAVLDDEATFALIFHPNFSTEDRVSELAGRGMGLAAVAAAVHELGGAYEVKTQKNQGLQFVIKVPALNRNAA